MKRENNISTNPLILIWGLTTEGRAGVENGGERERDVD